MRKLDSVEDEMMNKNDFQPLHAAIKRALNEARLARPRSTASALALLTLSAAALSPQAHAGDHSAGASDDFHDVIEAVNADPDASATITLTGDITLTSTAAFPALNKPVTIITDGYTLSGQIGTNPGGSLSFSGNTVTVEGAGEMRGGDGLDGAAASPLSGGTALLMTNGSVVNRASISGGNGGQNTNGYSGHGGIGASVTNGTLTNDGSITGGSGGDKVSGTSGAGDGNDAVRATNTTVINNGTLTGGRGGDSTSTLAGGRGAFGAVLDGGSLVNNGTIRGGMGGLNASNLTGPSGHGVRLTGPAELTNNSGAVIEGAAVNPGASDGNAGNGVLIGGNNILTNHGTIRGGSGMASTTLSGYGNGIYQNAAGTTTITNTGTIEGGANQRAIATINVGFPSIPQVNLTVINSGTIRAGAGQATAIEFSPLASSTTTLELRPGSVIEGNVLALSTNVNDTFRLGGEGEGTFDVSGLATQYQGFANFEKTGTSLWTLTGTGSSASGGSAALTWSLLGGTVSAASAAQLGVSTNFSNGATLRNTAAFSYSRPISFRDGGGVIDTQADLTLTSNLQGTGSLTKRGAATLIVTNSFNTFSGSTTIAEGTLQFGSGGGTGGFLSTDGITNNGALAFNRSNALTVNYLISGTGSVIQRGTGTTTLTANNTYTGETHVDSGILRINGDQSAATGLVSVANGATLGGGGIIGGAVTIADGGHLAPGNSPGTLTMGSLTLSSGSVLDFELGEANAVNSTLNDLINVNGDLTLDGTLNVSLSAGGTYGAGIYRLINYTGTLTDNGLDLDLMPASSANYVQTSVANQVNLINTQGLVLNYWDGAPSTRNDGQIGGGSGIWQAGGNDNWATADAAINADYQDGAMVIFGGTAGTVTVDDSLGPISVSGLQFASGGYRIEGDAIELGTGLNSVRVGDGSDAGASFTAMIANALTGDGTLDKTDLGTLVLTGENSYTGGTTISAGTLQLGDGGTSGSVAGDITNTATLVANRSDTLTLNGVISGTGAFRQEGTGTTILAAAGSTLNTLDVQHGALEVASGASVVANTTTIASGATLRNGGTFSGTAGDDTLTLAGTLVGSVGLLDGNDTVQIGDGATFSEATLDGGAGVDTLDLTYGSAFTLPQTLATGFEHLVKRGNGAVTLTGTVDTFSDSITVAEGSLHLSGAAIDTDELRIEHDATVTGTGSLSGNLLNAGVLSPGNSPGTIHVGGNYVQDASGALVSEITQTGTDLLDVAGAATLAGTHQVHVEYGLYLDGTTQTLVQAAGGVSGAFDSVEINPSALMSADHEVDANSVAVSFERQAMTSIVDPNSNQGQYAAWLDEQIEAGGLTSEMLAYVDTLLQQPTAADAARLFSVVAEPPAAISQNGVSTLGAGYARAVFDRFALGDVACAAAQGASDALNCSWIQGLRQWGDADRDAFGSGYDWTTDGVQFGFDRRLSSWTVGASFGYADTDTSDAEGAHHELRSKMGGLYASYLAGRLGFDAVALYANNENRTQRNVVLGTTVHRAEAEFDSDSFGIGARLSYRLTSENAPLVRPFAELFFDRIEAAEFTEQNAAVGNLAVRVHERDGLRGTAGLQLSESYEGLGVVFRPLLEIGVAHQFEDTQSALDVQPFGSQESFRAYGTKLDRTAYLGKASLDISLWRNAALKLGYSGELANDYAHHEASLALRIVW